MSRSIVKNVTFSHFERLPEKYASKTKVFGAAADKQVYSSPVVRCAP